LEGPGVMEMKPLNKMDGKVLPGGETCEPTGKGNNQMGASNSNWKGKRKKKLLVIIFALARGGARLSYATAMRRGKKDGARSRSLSGVEGLGKKTLLARRSAQERHYVVTTAVIGEGNDVVYDQLGRTAIER